MTEARADLNAEVEANQMNDENVMNMSESEMERDSENEHDEKASSETSPTPEIDVDSLVSQIQTQINENARAGNEIQRQLLESEDEAIQQQQPAQDQHDEDVISELNRQIPAAAVRDQSKMNANNGPNSLTKFFIDNDILPHLDTFKEYGFDLVDIVVQVDLDTLLSWGILLGQAMKLDHVFRKYKDEQQEHKNNDDGHQYYSNVHYQRRKQKKSRLLQLNDVVVEEQVIGSRSIKHSGPPPSRQLKLKYRDRVYNIMLVECRSTSAKLVVKMVGDRTKNGDISAVRYEYDEELQMHPNAPPRVVYAGSGVLQDIGLWIVTKEEWIEKGPGGHPSYAATIERAKLSVLWDRLSSSGRRKLNDFIKGHPGVNMNQYARNTGDYLNARTLGLLGYGIEPQFDKTLQEMIEANDE